MTSQPRDAGTPRGELRRARARARRALPLARRRRRRSKMSDPLADRPWITVDLHMHTSWSHDCLVEPGSSSSTRSRRARRDRGDRPAMRRRRPGDGGGRARDDLLVIPGRGGQDGQPGRGDRPLPRARDPQSMPFADTIAAIKEQGGLVYLPHPFDRMHSIPDAKTIHPPCPTSTCSRSTTPALFEQYNDEALRFARKYNLTMGAGSDAHVLPGVGTGGLRMREFADRDEFLVAPSTAEVLRRPRSLAYPSPQVDRPGQGSWRAEPEPCRLCLPPTRSTSATRRRSPRRTSSVTRSDGPAKDGFRRSDRASARRHLPPQVPAAALAEIQEGVAFFGRAGQALVKSLQRLIDPLAVYGTNCFKFDGEVRATGGRVAPASCTSSSQAARGDGRGRACVRERARLPAGRGAGAKPGESSSGRRRWKRSTSPTSTPRSTSRRRRHASGGR